MDMEASRDYRSIVHSPPFTFLVGPNHTKLTVQSGLARHVSQPLDHLMNSGLTRESKHHIAVLEEEDVETFVAFCEYAYTGDYVVPPPGSREEDQEKVVNNPFKGVFSDEPVSPTLSPFVSSAPKPGDTPSKEERKQDETEWQHVEETPQPGTPEHGDEGNLETGESSSPPADMPQDSAATPEESSEQAPLATPAQEEGDPLDFNGEGSSSKGKKGKKNKKDKKKQKGGASTEEQTTNLTPPSTPPPEEGETAPAAETTAELDEWGQPLESKETAEVGEPTEPADAAEPADNAPSAIAESWEQSAPTPPEVETADNWKTDDKESYRDERTGPSNQARPMIDTSFAKQQFSCPHEKGVSLWDEFAAMDYVDPRALYGTRPPSSLSAHSCSSRSELPYLIFHAKVYVFATRYLIPALAQLCLRKLHRDLLYLAFADAQFDDQDDERIALTTTKARMVVDLLHYTYTKTTRLEPISPTSATQLRDNELRKLVVHYAACKVRDLAEYCPPIERAVGSPLSYSEKPSARGMRVLLDNTTELASDLVYRMMCI